FIFWPRVTAGGRIGQAVRGARMLASDDSDEIAGFAAELDRINKERRALQDRILLEALEQVEQIPGIHSPNGPQVICIAMQGWHAGVIGIVAGRLKDRFNRPAIVIGIDAHGVGKGSGRSMYGVDMGTAIIAARAQGILDAGGGHAMAAGLTVAEDKIEEFQSFIENYLRDEVVEARKNSALKIDALLSPSAVGVDLIKEIDRVGPYGAKMPEPLFAFADMRVTYAQRLNGGHVRCAFEDSSGTRLAGIAFRADETGIAEILLSPTPPKVHIAARLKENTWKGRTKIDVQISDLAIAE
ncbi:MAG: DHH family phosphoesterase, partial [Robiginitomaculum sp.]|nr:DHH family phosphoesterase [Robiginitomaculum sp.]